MKQESRTQVCPPEFQWNSTLNKCIDCVPGYYGFQCSKSCEAPFYGVGCQKRCSGCSIRLCDVSYGCPSITVEARISTTSLLFITTTIENRKSSLLRETTVTQTESSSIASESSTTVNGFIKEGRTTLNVLLGSTTPSPSFLNSYYPVLLGILGVCVLFLVIFTIYVSIHIHEKCSQRRKSPKMSSISLKEDNATYEEIRHFEMVGNLIRYDPFIERNTLLTMEQSNQSTTAVTSSDYEDVPIKEGTNGNEPRDCDYIDVIQEEVVKHTYTHPIKITASINEEQNLNTHYNSPPKDKDGYVLPNTVCLNSVGISGDKVGTVSMALHPQLANDNISSDSENTSDSSTKDYLTVVSS